VSFNQSLYNVDEDDGQAQPVVVLNVRFSIDITVIILSTNTTATGKY